MADWPMGSRGSSSSSSEPGGRSGGGRRRDGRAGLLRATHRQHTSPGIGEDQHAGNTNKTAFPGTWRHDR